MRTRTDAVSLGSRLEGLARAAVMAALAVIVAYLGWASRGWPLIHDAPLMHYIAWRIAQGALPYRDLFDMNAPGVYLVHRAVVTLLGPGDVGWRAFDLGWLAATALGMVAFVWPFGRVPAAIAALLFGLYHLAGGVWLAGQRDFLLCPLLVGSSALVCNARGGLRSWLGGLLAGMAVTIKPPAALFVVILVLAAGGSARRAGKAPSRSVALVAAGSALPPLACAAWLVWIGAWPSFVSVFREYVVPLYTRLGRVPIWTAIGWWPLGYRVWGLFGLLILAAFATLRWDVRRWLLLGGVLYGAVHFLGQGKGWEYHVYPLAVFACAAAGVAVANPRPLIRWGALATLAMLTGVLATKGIQELLPNWIAGKAERVGRITADLDGRLGPTDTVQILDTGEGGIHALYRLGVRQPTRFLYDFPFLHDVDRPVVQRLRNQLMRDLIAHPPKFVVVLRQGWPAGGYERLERFPDLWSWLHSQYRLDRDGGDYRVYLHVGSRQHSFGHWAVAVWWSPDIDSATGGLHTGERSAGGPAPGRPGRHS